jgi:hypothetical protein
MQFIAGGLNGKFLLNILQNSLKITKSVYAAIAYASSDPLLFKECRNRGIRLKFWGRYDKSVPVTTSILKKFLDAKSSNYECKLVPDIFHPKVIWWKDFGIYMGSANLTENGWFNNIEAGIFLTNEEIVENDLTEDINEFFYEIDQRSYPLTVEIYNELQRMESENSKIDKQINDIEKKFQVKRIIPKLNPLLLKNRKPSEERKREAFIKEWNETLQLLRNLADKVSSDEYRPAWIKDNVPKGVQADQFLHAFYYSNVRVGTRALHHEFHQRNKIDPEKALIEEMNWWKLLTAAPTKEDITIYEWATYLKENLEKDKILSLSERDFIEVCRKIHAMRDHCLRVKYSEFGFDKQLPKMNVDQRIDLFGSWLYKEKSEKRKTVLDTIYYVLYDGEKDDVSKRLWHAMNSEEWYIPHLGVSSLGEIVGWAMPDYFPPRNGRTSKALYALGFDVRIHSE